MRADAIGDGVSLFSGLAEPDLSPADLQPARLHGPARDPDATQMRRAALACLSHDRLPGHGLPFRFVNAIRRVQALTTRIGEA